jgi:hypothetical protein
VGFSGNACLSAGWGGSRSKRCGHASLRCLWDCLHASQLPACMQVSDFNDLPACVPTCLPVFVADSTPASKLQVLMCSCEGIRAAAAMLHVHIISQQQHHTVQLPYHTAQAHRLPHPCNIVPRAYRRWAAWVYSTTAATLLPPLPSPTALNSYFQSTTTNP